MHTTPWPSQPERRAAAAGSVHYERHRPERTTLYRLVQQHAASFIAHTEASTGSELPGFIKDEFGAYLKDKLFDPLGMTSPRTPAARPAV